MKIKLKQKLHRGQKAILSWALRFNVICCGRRWGKTAMAVILAYVTALAGKRCGFYAPVYEDMEESWTKLHFLTKRFWKRPMSIRLGSPLILYNGGRIDFWSLKDNPHASRGRFYHRIIIDEAAKVQRLEEAWNGAIRPTLSDYRGDGWFLSTPQRLNYFKDLFMRHRTRGDRWRAWRLPTITNPYIDPEEIEEARLDLPELYFRQEYMAEFVDSFGVIFKPHENYYRTAELPRFGGYRDATGCDFAYTYGSGDWTVFCEGRLYEEIIFITDVWRERSESTTWAPWLKNYPNPFCFVGGQEKGIADFLRKDYNIDLNTEPAVRDKLARAMPVATKWNRGEILLPEDAPWLETFRSELLSFTGAGDEEDDQVDALAALHWALIGFSRPIGGIIVRTHGSW